MTFSLTMIMKKMYALFVLLLFSCNNDNLVSQQISQLEKSIEKTNLNKFARENELSALGYIYINKDSIFKDEIKKIHDNKELTSYFRSKGITKHSDIVSIVFVSLHRKLNSKELNLSLEIKNTNRLNRELLNSSK